MPKDTAVDLGLISTQDLIREIHKRHENAIVVYEDRKDSELLHIFPKAHADGEGFDLVVNVGMLHTAAEQLLHDFFEDMRAEDTET